ncbi:hypothetical protein [Planococcus shenhongbingii]|uniref:YrzO family protein n=1 Tax=Planococcus shenhongbingii TaxID=3058398 RepID=A0ABT8NGS6_9BACL|nr:hypothetical protein [Planococcus sp. N017]MDN7247098.1 hypothetical protein [Planococcus sp. N017]
MAIGIKRNTTRASEITSLGILYGCLFIVCTFQINLKNEKRQSEVSHLKQIIKNIANDA